MKGTRYMRISLQERERRLILALGSEWSTRTQIAERLGKSRLNTGEVTSLDYLAANGRIEKDLQTHPDYPGSNRWVYRAKGGVSVK